MPFYRQCAGIVLFNAEKKVLVCARKDQSRFSWQFPQGGIEKGETPAEAAVRELREETSVTSVEVVKTLEKSVPYTFPPKIRERLRGMYGQALYWSLLRFTGENTEINLATETPEFKAWQWVPIDEAVRRAVDFKRKTYQAAAQAFKPLIEENCTEDAAL